ncbi:succinate dehydrogenase assembly factor 2 [Candidatus Pelagibacter bacterium]|nr:succinate dehydrogenase assembly factor 2 [Candidatus Pelagibacter bacterium]
MSNKLEIFKKRLIYRATYRGTKEMDILLSSFVKKHINTFNEKSLVKLENFLNLSDEQILNYYNNKFTEESISENEVLKLFKNHEI